MCAALIHLVGCKSMLMFPDVLGDKNGMQMKFFHVWVVWYFFFKKKIDRKRFNNTKINKV